MINNQEDKNRKLPMNVFRRISAKMMTPSQRRILRKFAAPYKRRGIKKDFTLISNNCWGGITYDKLGLKYLSPTIGLIILPNDYLKFLENLDHYLSLTPVPYPDQPNDRKTNYMPHLYKAWLGDITLNFIHYKTIDDAIAKWEKRKKRIVKNNIIIKWSDFEFPSQKDEDEALERFDKLPYKKLLFTTKKEICSKYDYAYLFSAKSDNHNMIDDEFHMSDKIVGLKQLKVIINK